MSLPFRPAFRPAWGNIDRARQCSRRRGVSRPIGAGDLLVAAVRHPEAVQWVPQPHLLPLQDRNGLAPIAGHQDRVAALL